MLFCKTLACMCVVFLVAGCSAKKESTGKKDAVKSTKTVQLSDPAKKDIFDEFYDSSSQKSPASKETFSTQGRQPSTGVAKSVVAGSTNGAYALQISTVRSENFANQLVEKLRAKGFGAYVARVENPTPTVSGTFYRIRIGGFNGITEAKQFAESNLVAEGYEYWIDKKSNDNVGMEGYGFGESAPASSYQEYSPASTSSATTGSWSSGSSSSSYSSEPAATPAPTAETPPAVIVPEPDPAPAAPAPVPAQEPAAPAPRAPAAKEPASGSSTTPSSSGSSSGWGDDGWDK